MPQDCHIYRLISKHYNSKDSVQSPRAPTWPCEGLQLYGYIEFITYVCACSSNRPFEAIYIYTCLEPIIYVLRYWCRGGGVGVVVAPDPFAHVARTLWNIEIRRQIAATSRRLIWHWLFLPITNHLWVVQLVARRVCRQTLFRNTRAFIFRWTANNSDWFVNLRSVYTIVCTIDHVVIVVVFSALIFFCVWFTLVTLFISVFFFFVFSSFITIATRLRNWNPIKIWLENDEH